MHNITGKDFLKLMGTKMERNSGDSASILANSSSQNISRQSTGLSDAGPCPTPPPEMNGMIDESEPLNFQISNHAPYNKLFDVSCPTPWSVVKRIASELGLYIRYGFKLLGYLGLGECECVFLSVHYCQLRLA